MARHASAVHGVDRHGTGAAVKALTPGEAPGGQAIRNPTPTALTGPVFRHTLSEKKYFTAQSETGERPPHRRSGSVTTIRRYRWVPQKKGEEAPYSAADLADVVRTRLGRYQGYAKVSVLVNRAQNSVFFGVSSSVRRTLRAWSGVDSKRLQKALEKVPAGQQALGHGFCAEIHCLDQADTEGIDVTGGFSWAAHLDTGNAARPCTTCANVLKQYGVEY